MAIATWVGAAQSVPQITTIAVSGTWATDDTASITCNHKTITVTVGSNTDTSDIAEILGRSINAFSVTDNLQNDETRNEGGQTYGEFKDFVATYSGSTLTLTSTKHTETDSTYWPFTVTVTESTAGNGALGTVTESQACTGPTFWDNNDNWAGGSKPAEADVAEFTQGSVNLRHNLNNSVQAVAIRRYNGYTGDIGKELVNNEWTVYNPNGTVLTDFSFQEYRETHLEVPGKASTNTTHIIGTANAGIVAAGRTYLDCGATATSQHLLGVAATEGESTTLGAPVKIRGGIDWVVSVTQGVVEIGDRATNDEAGNAINQPDILSMTVDGANSVVRVINATIDASFTNLKVYDGAVWFYALTSNAVAAVQVYGGNLYSSPVDGHGTVDVFGGTFHDIGNGGATIRVHNGGTLRSYDDSGGGTWTNCSFHRGFAFYDRNNTFTFNNGIDFVGCTPRDGKFVVQDNQTWTPSAI